MERFIEIIKSLGTVTTIGELNKAHMEAVTTVMEIQSRGMWEGIADHNKLCDMINHIANYNIVRVANIAYEKYTAEDISKTDVISDITLCYNSIKEHSDNSTEKELLSYFLKKLKLKE